MSKLGTPILCLAVLLIGAVAAFLAFKAASSIFAIHMVIIVLACVLFLAFIARRNTAFDPPQG